MKQIKLKEEWVRFLQEEPFRMSKEEAVKELIEFVAQIERIYFKEMNDTC